VVQLQTDIGKDMTRAAGPLTRFFMPLQNVDRCSDGAALADLAGNARAQLALPLPQKWKQMTFTSADKIIAQLEEQAKQRQVLLIDTFIESCTLPALSTVYGILPKSKTIQHSSTHC
jgi:hypothetical protein